MLKAEVYDTSRARKEEPPEYQTRSERSVRTKRSSHWGSSVLSTQAEYSPVSVPTSFAILITEGDPLRAFHAT
jgi:hypothetical protein